MGELERDFSAFFFSQMGHPAAVWDYKAATEITKDWNGIDQVMLRNPQGASARVRVSMCTFFSWSWMLKKSIEYSF